ncbi:MAG: FAD-dependent oxidoreductase [Planctomycetota bacterium]|nr:FAD-dependent oxidoreductase [Planctomycetota bacterium]MDA1214624.1 FAD-dependent oxidoreductase [Planctomycetota bacterium]
MTSKQKAATPSQQVAAKDVAENESSADVIVVGAGISGLTTALELGRGGARVTVIDMSSVYGGHAVMSQGSLCLIGSPVQKERGIVDSPELAYNDFLTFGEDPNEAWVRYYVDHSITEIYDWVTELGVRFETVYASPGNSADREHQPFGRGIGLVTPIYRACLEQPTVRFLWNNKVEQLLTENGRVVGVKAIDQRTGAEKTLHASSVVLATGGFQSNLDMVREYWPEEFRFPERILLGSGRNSVGWGHKLAQEIGGDLVKMDHQWNYYTGIPDPRYPDTKRGLSAANMAGIIVNDEAQRFANSHGWAKAVMPPLLRRKNATLWWIFDEAIKPQFIVSGTDWADFKKVEREILNNPQLVHIADTWEELAEKAGLSKENLIATIERYNDMVKKGVDEDFHRFGPESTEYSNTHSPALLTPPFYAMQAWPLTRKSMGGIAIDLKCRVLDKHDEPIPGLYAVGECSGLAGVNGKAALEGTFLGPCIVTGRVSARNILAELKEDKASRLAISDSTRCADCHDMPDLLSQDREGYWHFENVHRVVLERGTDCRQCHAELSPYRDDDHKITPQVLAASCFHCHIAQE